MTEATAPYTILFVICTYHYHYFVNILYIGNTHSEIFNQDCQQWQYSLNDTFLYLDPWKINYAFIQLWIYIENIIKTLCDPMDCHLPGSPVHGILQTKIVEWIAYPFSRASSQCRDRTQVSCIAGGFFTVWTTSGAHIYINTYVYMYTYVCIYRVGTSFTWM